VFGTLAAAAWAVLATQAGASAATSAPNDPWYATGAQWGLLEAGFPAAWCASTGAGALIAVIDGGVDFGHPDLAGKSAGSYSVIPPPPPGVPPYTGHATHVAGIAAADTNNGVGMAGAAPDASLYSVRMLDANGQGSSTDLAAAIDYVTNSVAPGWSGPVVMNISVGAVTNSTPPEVDAALQRAARNPRIGIALAAGDQPGTSGYDQERGRAMVVGALTQAGGYAGYSPTSGINVSAAGGASNSSGTNVGTGIVSTYTGGQYAWQTGTSMSTPLVSAALALLMSRGYNNTAAYQRIQSTEGPGGALRIDRALGAVGSCGQAVAPPPPVIRPVSRPPVQAAAPAPAPRSVQTAPPAAPAITAPTAAPVLPNSATVPYDESTHPHQVLPAPGPLATAVVSLPTSFDGLLATTSAGAQTDIGRTTLAAAAGFAVAYAVSLALWRRLQRIKPARPVPRLTTRER
jgi:subtilisin family serine protease